MNLREWKPPRMILPGFLRERFYGEAWQKERIDVAVRNQADALLLRAHPLPHLELRFQVTNTLPVPLQVFGASVEIWLGKPVVQFYTFLSESLRPQETRESLRAVTFPNPFQLDLLNPPAKDSLPPNVTVVLTVSCRSSLGIIEKTATSAWLAPKVSP